MSKFITTLPVDLAGVVKSLPAGSYLHAVRLNPVTSVVEIEWEHDAFRTPWTFGADFPLADLQGRKVPKHVTVVRRVPTPETKTVGAAAAPVRKSRADETRARKNSATAARGATRAGRGPRLDA